MAMTRIEKQFVNRDRKAERNIEKVRQCLEKLDSQKIHQVLEIGCGTGAVSAYLASNYQMKVYGTDFDPEQIELAKKLFLEDDHLHFLVEDASNLNFELLSFDDEIYEVGILVNVKRVSDKRKFVIPLAELEAGDKKSKNYQLLDDYSVWFVNY